MMPSPIEWHHSASCRSLIPRDLLPNCCDRRAPLFEPECGHRYSFAVLDGCTNHCLPALRRRETDNWRIFVFQESTCRGTPPHSGLRRLRGQSGMRTHESRAHRAPHCPGAFHPPVCARNLPVRWIVAIPSRLVYLARVAKFSSFGHSVRAVMCSYDPCNHGDFRPSRACTQGASSLSKSVVALPTYWSC